MWFKHSSLYAAIKWIVKPKATVSRRSVQMDLRTLSRGELTPGITQHAVSCLKPSKSRERPLCQREPLAVFMEMDLRPWTHFTSTLTSLLMSAKFFHSQFLSLIRFLSITLNSFIETNQLYRAFFFFFFYSGASSFFLFCILRHNKSWCSEKIPWPIYTASNALSLLWSLPPLTIHCKSFLWPF